METWTRWFSLLSLPCGLILFDFPIPKWHAWFISGLWSLVSLSTSLIAFCFLFSLHWNSLGNSQHSIASFWMPPVCRLTPLFPNSFPIFQIISANVHSLFLFGFIIVFSNSMCQKLIFFLIYFQPFLLSFIHIETSLSALLKRQEMFSSIYFLSYIQTIVKSFNCQVKYMMLFFCFLDEIYTIIIICFDFCNLVLSGLPWS